MLDRHQTLWPRLPNDVTLERHKLYTSICDTQVKIKSRKKKLCQLRGTTIEHLGRISLSSLSLVLVSMGLYYSGPTEVLPHRGRSPLHRHIGRESRRGRNFRSRGAASKELLNYCRCTATLFRMKINCYRCWQLLRVTMQNMTKPRSMRKPVRIFLRSLGLLLALAALDCLLPSSPPSWVGSTTLPLGQHIVVYRTFVPCPTGIFILQCVSTLHAGRFLNLAELLRNFITFGKGRKFPNSNYWGSAPTLAWTERKFQAFDVRLPTLQPNWGL